ncbi:hypothetical protein DM793_04010 [Paenarthrobacter nitroguajacolicus]|uniref:hypothetical protein n=1 Tax=Paenarthrobacter nitroguajacolicus TaxID=211146 RepID=UPI0015BDBEAF|nr:hypothetical protein [Paenarthrobacter nitroguajacolicus]NWL10467.1 hypothetical protein [Paenarthrobacter nitroguajacolicus]
MTSTPARPQPAPPQRPAPRQQPRNPGWPVLQGLCVTVAVLGQGILAYAPITAIAANTVLALTLAVTATILSTASAYTAGRVWNHHRPAALAMALSWALLGAALSTCWYLIPDITGPEIAASAAAAEYAQALEKLQITYHLRALLYAALYTGTGALTILWAAHHSPRRTHPC